MNYTMLMATLLAAFGLSACDRPNVVNVPPAAVVVPGPAGPAGATGASGVQGAQGMTGSEGMQGSPGYDGNKGERGSPGYDGSKGEPGKTGAGTTVIVVPPAASQPSN
jgi:hypothetical protein